MAFRTEQPTFAGGEISRHMEARIDTAKRATGARRARNVMVRPEGGLMSRPGFQFVGEVHDSDQPAWLIPFVFSPDQAYALTFGQGDMRPATNGGFVLEQDLNVTAITNAAEAQITALFHGYSVGNDIYLTGILGMVEINNRVVRVTSVLDADNFTVDVDSTLYAAFTGCATGETRVGAPGADPTVPVPPEDPGPDGPDVTFPPGAAVP